MATTLPDVSVIIPVYNTMPYLTECLDSLLRQSIGPGRMEVVAVDDGSTDGSGRELDRYAALRPGGFKVLKQANSGGPASPCNRALEAARGRYVFFLGSDDYLGEEAMERMVAAADEHGSDVVYAKMAPVNGRAVPIAVFARTVPDMALGSGKLPWALSNTKLFRRAFIERHRLRFMEDLPAFSDQPFTLEAVFRAGRVSVLGDYDYYFAVRRSDESNVTLSSRRVDRLRALVRIMEVTQRFTEPGRIRDSFHLRHLDWEAQLLLDENLLTDTPDERQHLFDGVRRLAVAHLNEAVLPKLRVSRRLRLSHAKAGDLDGLLAVIRYERDHGTPPVVVRGTRAYAGYPCFTAPERTLPDACYDITKPTLRRVAEQQCTVTGVDWADGDLVVRVHSTLPDLAEFGPGAVRSSIGRVVRCAEAAPEGEGSDVEVRVPAAELPLGRTALRLSTSLMEVAGAVEVPGALELPALRHRKGLNLRRLTVERDSTGRLQVAVAPIRPARVAQLRLQRLAHAARGADAS
ncbi:glycosyltransferase [Streptomyces sp. NPDC050738]|uniref:glycosyltransferase family 2 protein n=1 Tax=Streptomyces sp. NPDC050738 TaxID=3154744 RepID=UPI0034178477